MANEYWFFTGLNAILLTIVAFFIRSWIMDVKQKLKEHDEHIFTLNNENGKRKGDNELLKKDIELLSQKTTSNFESLKYQMDHQTKTLDEIRTTLKENSKEENNVLLQLIKQLNLNNK